MIWASESRCWAASCCCCCFKASELLLFSCCKRRNSRRSVDSPGTFIMELEGKKAQQGPPGASMPRGTLPLKDRPLGSTDGKWASFSSRALHSMACYPWEAKGALGGQLPCLMPLVEPNCHPQQGADPAGIGLHLQLCQSPSPYLGSPSSPRPSSSSSLPLYSYSVSSVRRQHRDLGTERGYKRWPSPGVHSKDVGSAPLLPTHAPFSPRFLRVRSMWSLSWIRTCRSVGWSRMKGNLRSCSVGGLLV